MWSLNKWFHCKMYFLSCGSLALSISRQHGFNPYHNKYVSNIYAVLDMGEEEEKGRQSSPGNVCPQMQLCLLPSRWQEETWQFQTFCCSLEVQFLLRLQGTPLGTPPSALTLDSCALGMPAPFYNRHLIHDQMTRIQDRHLHCSECGGPRPICHTQLGFLFPVFFKEMRKNSSFKSTELEWSKHAKHAMLSSFHNYERQK